MIGGSLPDAALPKGHPCAKLMLAAHGAWHLCQSLLACRPGATDDLIREVAGALHEAIVVTALSASAPERPGQ